MDTSLNDSKKIIVTETQTLLYRQQKNIHASELIIRQ